MHFHLLVMANITEGIFTFPDVKKPKQKTEISNTSRNFIYQTEVLNTSIT